MESARKILLCFLGYTAIYPLDRLLLQPAINGIIQRQTYGPALFAGLVILLVAKSAFILIPPFLMGWGARKNAALWGLACLPCFLASFILISAIAEGWRVHMGINVWPSNAAESVSFAAFILLFAALGITGSAAGRSKGRAVAQRRSKRKAVG